ncbi:MAG: hypothetical protein ACI38Q_02360 [Candidatus Bruticola sp.]
MSDSSSPKDNKKKEKKNTKQDKKATASAAAQNGNSDKQQTTFLTKQQRALYCLCFAGMGLMMGFLWGANSIIDAGQSASPLVQAAKASLAIATTAADIGKGSYYGLVGAIIGLSLGYSISLDSKPMLNSLIFGCIGLLIGVYIGGASLAGVGWILGYGIVIGKAIGLDRYRQVYAEVAQERDSKSSKKSKS